MEKCCPYTAVEECLNVFPCIVNMHPYVWSLHALSEILYLSRVTHTHWLWEFASRAMAREWNEYKRELGLAREREGETKSRTDRAEGEKTDRKWKAVRRDGWDCLTSCTERAQSPCGLPMRGSVKGGRREAGEEHNTGLSNQLCSLSLSTALATHSIAH